MPSPPPTPRHEAMVWLERADIDSLTYKARRLDYPEMVDIVLAVLVTHIQQLPALEKGTTVVGHYYADADFVRLADVLALLRDTTPQDVSQEPCHDE